MKNLIPVSAAGVLAFGAVGAHASIALPSTGSSDAVLFAEVLNGTSVVASYAGDTGLTVSQMQSLSGTSTVLSGDANLAKLFAADASGDTVVFAVQGATQNGTATVNPGVANLISTTQLNAAPTPRNTVLSGYLTAYSAGITSLNSNLLSANSIEGTNPSASGIWDVDTTSGIAYWGGTLDSASPTTTSATNIYYITGSGGSFGTVSSKLEATATLSASGLVLTGTTAPVPVPAAVWLFGSGLLGLASVARRKAKA